MREYGNGVGSTQGLYADIVLWLSAFREASVETMQKAAARMDFEALSALLRRRLLIAHKPRDDRSEDDPIPEWLANPSPDIEPLMETPDRRFIIAARKHDEDELLNEFVDDEDRKWILQFVKELYQQEDWESIATVLRSASADLTSTLEEDAYRFRTARLEDIGFPPRDRAMEVYGLLDPSPVTPMTDAPLVELALPATYAPPLQEGLFHAAMQRIDDPAQMRRLEGDLVAVANKALVADGVTPGQSEGLQEVLQRLRGYVELALAEGTPPASRLEQATLRLANEHLERLFRVGYTLTVRAAGRARRLLQRDVMGQGAPNRGLKKLSTAEQGVLEALLLKRPRMSGALEPIVEALGDAANASGDTSNVTGDASKVTGPLRLDPGAAEVRRPFLKPADLMAVRWVLDELEAFADAWSSHAPDRPDMPDAVNLPTEEQTFDVELTTALVHAMAERPYAIVPLTGQQLADTADGLRLDDRKRPLFSDEGIQRAVQAAGGAPIQSRVERCLAELAEQLWPHVGRDRIDPRYVEAVITAL
ncbi:MAG: DUF6178 family protein [Myxococcota bacterium]